MNVVLKAKHWQIFTAFIALQVLDELGWFRGELVGDISYSLAIAVYFGWIMALGSKLNNKLEKRDGRSYLIFLIIGVTLAVSAITSRFWFDENEVAKLPETTSFKIIYFSFGFVLLASMFIFFSFPAKTLKKIETKDPIDINDYFGDIFLFLFFPLGVWTLQPRINKIPR